MSDKRFRIQKNVFLSFYKDFLLLYSKYFILQMFKSLVDNTDKWWNNIRQWFYSTCYNVIHLFEFDQANQGEISICILFLIFFIWSCQTLRPYAARFFAYLCRWLSHPNPMGSTFRLPVPTAHIPRPVYSFYILLLEWYLHVRSKVVRWELKKVMCVEMKHLLS